MGSNISEATDIIWDNASALANFIDATRDYPDAPVSQLWNLQDEWNQRVNDDAQYKPQRIDFRTLSRMAWLVHPDRKSDLNQMALHAFRRCAKNKTPYEESAPLIHLSLHLLDDLNLVRNKYESWGNPLIRIVTPDQLAAIFHLSRIGASFRACQTFFQSPVNTLTVTATRSMTQGFFGKYTRPGWNWAS